MRFLPRPSAALMCLALGLRAVANAQDVPDATITKLIAEAQKQKPDWWDAVTLNYPSTLDLTCPSGGKWDATVKPGVWMWDVVDPNPGRWKEGTKFWHFVLTNAKQKKLVAAEEIAVGTLAKCYGELLQDWPRAAYWCLQADATSGPTDERTVALANAYWHLGSLSLALKTVKPLTQDTTRHGSLIKLLADLGEYKSAYALAQAKAAQCEDVGWYVTGYTAQLQGDWARALDGFKHAAASQQKNSGRDWKQTCARANAAVTAITLFEALDLKGVADGTYRDSSIGYVGPVTVEVVVAAHRITSVKVTDHHEKQFYASLQEVPAKIIAKQQVKGVDGTLGATITSDAIVFASAKALRQGQH